MSVIPIWGQELEAELVDMVRKNDILWDTKHEDYYNFRLRDEAFDEIATHLGKHFSGKDVKLKWGSIRSSFTHYRRRFEKLKKSKSDPKKVRNPTWHLWHLCQFLTNHCRHRSPKIFLKPKPESSQKRNGKDAEVTLSSGNKTKSSKSLSTSKSSKSIKGESINSLEKSSCEQVLAEALKILEILKNDPRLDLNVNGKYAELGQHISRTLSKLSSVEAEKASKEIVNILSFYEGSSS